jgi:hypothetical protein
VVLAYPLSRHCLVGGEALSSSVGGVLDCRRNQQNRIVQFFLFQTGVFHSYLIRVRTHFGDSTGESTTSSTPCMKGGNSDNNGSDLDKNYILKPTFDTLMKDGHKVFEAYHVNFEELFLLRCEVTRQRIVLQDTTPIVLNKPEVTPKV